MFDLIHWWVQVQLISLIFFLMFIPAKYEFRFFFCSAECQTAADMLPNFVISLFLCSYTAPFCAVFLSDLFCPFVFPHLFQFAFLSFHVIILMQHNYTTYFIFAFSSSVIITYYGCLLQIG